MRPYLKKPFTKIRLVEWLKEKALSSSPSTPPKKRKKKRKYEWNMQDLLEVIKRQKPMSHRHRRRRRGASYNHRKPIQQPNSRKLSRS
jgi:hypothetical protein